MDTILNLISDHLVAVVAGIILLLIPSPAGPVKKLLEFVKDLLKKLLEKWK